MSRHLNYAILSEQVIVADDGRGSIINTFDKIIADGLPIVHSRMAFLVSTRGDRGTEKIKVELIDEQASQTVTSVEGDSTIDVKTNNFIANFLNTRFERAGKYWFKVTIGDRVLTSPDTHYVIVETR